MTSSLLYLEKTAIRFEHLFGGGFCDDHNLQVGKFDPVFNSTKSPSEMHFSNEQLNTGISETVRTSMSAGLAKLLSDTYLLYLQTHNYHWNVRGPQFVSLHNLFMSQYLELALAVDLIAERIRGLGRPVPATFLEFSELATIKEERGVQSSERMVSMLKTGQETIIRIIRVLQVEAERDHDYVSADLLTQRLQVHEKNAWMLRSLLAD